MKPSQKQYGPDTGINEQVNRIEKSPPKSINPIHTMKS